VVRPLSTLSPSALAERRLQLLLEISDRLRFSSTLSAVMAVAAEAVGKALGVSRAGYGEIVERGEVVRVERDWTDGIVFSLAGEARVLDAFGPQVIDELRAGGPWWWRTASPTRAPAAPTWPPGKASARVR
jgi:GAF domain-containing protein